MKKESNTQLTPTQEGITVTGVGRKGSKPLSAELIEQIQKEWQTQDTKPLIKGAFLGALIMKGVTDEESVLESLIDDKAFNDFTILVNHLAQDAPEFIKWISTHLLNGRTLDEETSLTMGRFLFSDEPGDGLRGLIASILRVRYETPDEYAGILKSMQETIEPKWHRDFDSKKPIIQFAEPFDGCDHSNMITPLLSRYFQQNHYTTISLVGRNSGPKYGNNLLDLAQGLKAPLLTNAEDISSIENEYGLYINQADISPPMDRWVDYRRMIIKRPFLATLERFINPLKADILIASAFHPQYGEKMLTIAERAEFPAAIIVRNGLEGTMAFPLKRAAKVLCSARLEDGTYTRHEFDFQADQHIDMNVPVEEKLTDPSLAKNIDLIQRYTNQGSTGYDLFDWRIQATCLGLQKGVEWIESQSQNTKETV